VAVLAMFASSLTVIGNALRIFKKQSFLSIEESQSQFSKKRPGGANEEFV
jgi:hypothetical protein